jgi:type IV pilus assembly protein PilB
MNSSKDLSKKGRTDISEAAKGDDAPIITLVNEVLVQCKRTGASDIHIEPYESFIRIRLRIDGSLREIKRPSGDMKGALISRIKIMAKLNIAESRIPQDGAINITIDNQPIDFRVSSCPTVFGEKIVMRILDKSNLQVDMTQLGFDIKQLTEFKNAIAKPNGIVLVTGPTGSGKTTTLYSAIQELNKEDLNITTSEDPVEYSLSGVNQVQMKPDIGFNFAAALRSFLRQDPDVIMVGEIRDLETAEIAIKASLTGHMVLSTLHTNSATDTISRLLNMGAAPFNLVSSLNCITAQRLMKKICERCKEEDPDATPEALISLGIPEKFSTKVKAMRGRGCDHCGNSGNKGRIAIHEVLVINDAIREAILKGIPTDEMKKIAMKNGMNSLRQSALNNMAKGITSMAEVVRTTDDK